MQSVTFKLNGDYVELCNLLKLTGLADSGGRGKIMVAEGMVSVDGAIELRKTAKIRAGQIVECSGTRIVIEVNDAADSAATSPDHLA
jgi:ribosome-associated protein